MNILHLVPLFAVALVSYPIAYAQEQAEVQEELVTNPDQINPDSPLYFFDVIFDDLALVFQSSNLDRAKLAIKIADERLTEIKIMIDENKIPDAEEAQREHDKILTVAQNAVANIQLPDGFDEIRAKVEVEKGLEQHQIRIEAVSEELEIEIRVRGDLTPEQRELIAMILSEVEGKAGEVEIRIDNEKDRTRIRIETESGEIRTEIDNRIRNIEDEEKLPEVEIQFRNGVSMVEVEVGRNEFSFPVQSEDRDVIFADIERRTGLTRDQIIQVVEFERDGE